VIHDFEQAALCYDDNVEVVGHLEVLRSDRFVVRLAQLAADRRALTARFVLSLHEGVCEGFGRVAHVGSARGGELLVTIAALDFVGGEDAFRASLRRQLSSPTRDETDPRLRPADAADATPRPRPRAAFHHWEDETRSFRPT
jgi:hypothetical protein